MADEKKDFLISTIYKSAGLKNYVRDLNRAKATAKEFSITLSKQATLLEQKTTPFFNKQGDAVVRTTAILQDHGKKVRVTYDQLGTETKKVDASFTKFQGGLVRTGLELKKLITRAGLVIPVWLALRTAFTSVIRVTQDLVKEFLDLDKGMRRVIAVSRATADSQASIYKDLETEARRYFVTSSKGFKDITEAMYQLGTAGRSTEEIMQGFSHVLNLAIGTFGDVAIAGKTVTGILNVFEDQLKSVGNTEEQIQRVTDLLAFAWQNNQIELSEMNTAMSFLADVGGLLNLSIEEVITAQAVMNNRMLRGGKGARSLAQALVRVAQDASRLKGLGVVFDETKPLDFRDVMQQLVDIYGNQEGSLENLRELTEVFGRRGTRAIANLIENWDQFNARIEESTENIKGLAKELKENAEKNWSDLIKQLWRQQITSRDISRDISPLKQILIDMTEEAEAGTKIISQLQDNWKEVGDQIKLSREEALVLVGTLRALGAPKFGRQLAEQFGIVGDEMEKASNRFEQGFLSPEVQRISADFLLRVLDITKVLTRETKDQVEEQKEQEKIIIKLSAGEKERYENALLLEKAKASEQFTAEELLDIEKRLIQQTKFSLGEHEKLVKLREIENKLAVEEVKRRTEANKLEDTIAKRALEGQLELLKIQGATELQIITTRIELEKKLGIERKGIDYLEQQYELQKAITEENKKTTTERQRDLQKAIIQRQKEKRSQTAGEEISARFKGYWLESKARQAGLTQEEIDQILRPTAKLEADLPNSIKDLAGENIQLQNSMYDLQTAIESLTREILKQELAPDIDLPLLRTIIDQAVRQPIEDKRIAESLPAITRGREIEYGINKLIEINVGDTQVYLSSDVDSSVIARFVTEQLDIQNEQRKNTIIAEIARQLRTPNSDLNKASKLNFEEF